MGDPPATQGARWRIRRFADIDSTNRYALEASRSGAAPGLVVVADRQAAGRGRRGRTWSAPPGSSLLVSVVLAAPGSADDVHVVTMAAGLALADAVQVVAGVDADLKWPNDLVVGDRKLAGILAETDLRDGRVHRVVVGIGCNVTWGGYPEELAESATACDREAGRPVDRDALLAALLDRLAEHLESLDAVPARYRSRLATIGHPVRVELGDGTREGVARDVDDAGRLVVDTDDGPLVVAAGDVVHLRPVTDPGSGPPAL
jgi:BirA family transcriptional regulator, biotin operon repressor / biotin---[acetyl-CoA-carboxylase] ligase